MFRGNWKSVLVPGKCIENVVANGKQLLLELHVVIDVAVSHVVQVVGDDRSVEFRVSGKINRRGRRIDHGGIRAIARNLNERIGGRSLPAAEDLQHRGIITGIVDGIAGNGNRRVRIIGSILQVHDIQDYRPVLAGVR